MAESIQYIVNIRVTAQTDQFAQGMKNVNTHVGNLDKTLGRITRTFTAFAALFIARRMIQGVGEAVTGFAEFEKGLANIDILLNSSTNRIEDFKSTIRSLAKEYGVATKDLLKAGFDIQSAVGNVDRSLSILNDATRLAVAGGSDVASTTSGLITLMESYGDKLKGTADGADLLFLAQEKARATIGELSVSVSKFLPIASKMGVEVEELFAVYSQLTRALGNTREASTALGMFLQNLLKPTQRLQQESFKVFGTTIQQALATEGLIKVLEMLGKVQIDDLGKLISRQRAIKAVAAVTDDMATVTQFATEMLGRHGIVNERLAKQMDEPQKRIDKMKETWADTFRSIGDAISQTGILDSLLKISISTNKLLGSEEGLKLLANSFKNLALNIETVLMVLSPLKIILLGIVTILATFSDGLRGIRMGFMEFVSEVAHALGVLAGEMADLANTMNWQGVRGELIEFEKTFKIMAINIDKDIKAIIDQGSLTDNIIGSLALLETQKAMVEKTLEDIKISWDENTPKPDVEQEKATSIANIWGEFYGKMQKHLDDLGTANEVIGQQIYTAWTSIWSGFESAFSSAFSKMVLEGGKFKDILKGFWTDLKTAFVKAIGDMLASLISWGLQSLIMWGLQLKGIVAFGAAAAAALAPAAVFMSLITAGANAMGAMAGMLSTLGVAKGIQALGMLGMAEGGIVPGMGRGDKVPAMLSPGELVVPREQVRNFTNSPTINVTLTGNLLMNDPSQIQRFWRDNLREIVRNENKNGRDVWY